LNDVHVMNVDAGKADTMFEEIRRK